MDDEVFTKFWTLLGRQAKACWQELGYMDWVSPQGFAAGVVMSAVQDPAATAQLALT